MKIGSRRIGTGVLVVLGILQISTMPALAHAHLVSADLAPDRSIYVPAGTVRFWFDESLNQSLSSVVIKDAQGRQVNDDTGKLNPSNGEELDVAVPALSPGQYSVLWTSDSAQDGHILHGFYVFTAGGRGAPAIGASSGVLPGSDTPPLDSAGWASAIARWLVLVSSTVWTGALAWQLLVGAQALARTRGAVAALAAETGERLTSVVQFGLLGALVASVLEVEAQAYASGSSVFDVTTVRDILHSHFGAFWLIRLACVFLVQVLLILLPSPSNEQDPDVERPDWRAQGLMLSAGVLGMAYLVALAMSGHADAVAQMVATSVLLDWLHLLANTVWIGGMAAIALALVPALKHNVKASRGDANDTRLAFLVLLDRYSPWAWIAVPTAAVTGVFNAQVHLDSFDAFVSTEYGRFLVVKLILICVIVLISASHVGSSRPRLLAILAGQKTGAAAEGFPSLLRRLAAEPILGAGVLLCVALMTQVAPPVTVFGSGSRPTDGQALSTPAAGQAAPALPATISGSASKGPLGVTLTVDPAAVGHVRLFVAVHEHGRAVVDAQVRLKLSVPGQSSLGAVFVETTPSKGGYVGAGDLVQNGRWQADVLVRTRSDPLDYQDVPFQLIVGPGAGFLPNGIDPAAIQIAMSPARLNGPNTIDLSHLNAAAVQLLSESLDMDMGVETEPMLALSGARWRAMNVYPPMAGRWGLTVQVRVGGTWISLRQFVYQVPLSGPIVLLSGGKPAPAASSTSPKASAALTSAYNVAFAEKLPYTAIISQMGSNGVRLLGKPLLHTGVQAHGVDVMDGTPYALVTNFGDDPGTVSQIDMRSMKVVRRYDVGLGPAHVVFLPDHRHVFVTDFRSNDLYELDLENGSTTRITFPSGTCFEPHGIDLSEDSRTVYVACAGGSWIYPVNTATLRPGQAVITAPGAYGVAVDPQRHEVWVTNQTANSISVIDESTMTVVASFPVGKGPALLAVSPDGRTMYVADQLGNAISVVDAAGRKVTATIPVAAQPHGLDVTADGKYLYVASIGGNAVTIIRTADDKVAAVVPSLQGPNEVAIAK